MAVVRPQSSNVYAYAFPNPGNSGTNFLFIPKETNSVLNLSGTSWTAECWVKPVGNYADFGCIFTKRVGVSASSSYQGFLRQSSGVVSYYNGTEYNSSVRVTSNAWTHLAWTLSLGSGLTFFVNGVNVYTTAAVSNTTNFNCEFCIGGLFNANENYEGLISNLRIIKGQVIYTNNFDISSTPVQLPNNAIGAATGSNVAASLTGNVVLLTCNSDRLVDYGNNNLQLLPVGLVQPTVVNHEDLQSYSYEFSRSNMNSGVLLTTTSAALHLPANFTIEMWYYPITASGTILNKGGGANGNFSSYLLAWDNPNGNINFAASNSNTANYSVGSNTGPAGSLGAPTLNAWNHIAITRSANNWYGFLNGNVTLTITNNANTPIDSGARGLLIGGTYANGQVYGVGMPTDTIRGYISNLRILKGVALYTASFTPPRSPLGLLANSAYSTSLFTAASAGDDTTGTTTGEFEDLSRNVTISSNGGMSIIWSNFNPFTPNASSNSAFTEYEVRPTTYGYKNYKIIDKIDYTKFAVPFVHNYTIGCRLGKIIDKVDYTKFASPNVINAYTIGNRLGKIISAVVIPIKFAYIPTNTRNYDPTQYQFWS